jgi:thiosulfate dehydrogenase
VTPNAVTLSGVASPLRSKPLLIALLLVSAGIMAGLTAGYFRWGLKPDWYPAHDVWKLPPGPETDLIVYGYDLIVDTQRYIGPDVADKAMRFAGNNLACTNCHLRAGLQPFAAPLVSTFTTFPMMVDDRVVTLRERINGCMTRSMNGSGLPVDSREMKAFLAYIQFLGRGTPAGIRLPGMGLQPAAQPVRPPSADRGQIVYAAVCARCHDDDGQGRLRSAQAVDGYEVPPLWGAGSFNSSAGMSRLTTASAFVHANMPLGVDAGAAPISTQDAWDVAAFFTDQPRPAGPQRN